RLERGGVHLVVDEDRPAPAGVEEGPAFHAVEGVTRGGAPVDGDGVHPTLRILRLSKKGGPSRRIARRRSGRTVARAGAALPGVSPKVTPHPSPAPPARAGISHAAISVDSFGPWPARAGIMKSRTR